MTGSAALLAHTGIDHVAFSALAAAVVGALRAGGDARARLAMRGARGASRSGVAVVLVASLAGVRDARRSTRSPVTWCSTCSSSSSPRRCWSPASRCDCGERSARRAGTRRRRGASGAAWRQYGVVVAPFAFVVVLFVTHLTSIYDDALHDRWLHEAEHAAYLLSAVGGVGGGARRRSPRRPRHGSPPGSS